MLAYAHLQENEFERESDGYRAIKHQSFVGTGYFDSIAQAVAGDRFAYVPDLGIDKGMIYRFNAAQGSLVPNDPPSAAAPAGAGPRHFTLHPTGRFA